MRPVLATLLLSVPVALAGLPVFARQDDSTCQVKHGDGWRYCVGGNCFNEEAGFKCCLLGSVGTVCGPGQECDIQGKCMQAGVSSSSDDSTAAKDTGTSTSFDVATLTGSVTTEAISVPTEDSTLSDDSSSSTGASSTSASIASTTPETPSITSPQATSAQATSSQIVTASSSTTTGSPSAVPSSGDATGLAGGSVAWAVVGVLGLML